MMRIVTFLLPRHRRHAGLADAFVDGELSGGDLRRFEEHLPACAECRASVEGARTLKSGVGALPELAAPRSFRLTQAMVGTAAPARVRSTGTPLYLGLARAGAALSIGAFATVLAVSAFDSDGRQSADGDSGGSNEIMMTGAAAQDSAAPAAGSEFSTSAPEAPVPTATAPQLAPATAGGVGGAGIPSATVTAAAPTPVPPSTGVDMSATPFSQRSSGDNSEGSSPAADGAIAPVPPGPGVTSFEPLAKSSEDDGGLETWKVALGLLTAGSLGLLGFLELSRRRTAR